MTNPWLSIPASDYEGHMDHPNVAQLSFLGRTFGDSIIKYDCDSVAYLGCATGNGLEYVNHKKTHKITVIDINPEYLEILQERFKLKIPNLETIEADLNEYNGNNQQYSLIFAGLLFEYLTPITLLIKIATWLERGGALVVVLQLEDQHIKKVSDTPYTSLKLLNSIMKPVSVQDFRLMASEAGLKEIDDQRVVLESGKAFYIGAYQKSA
jgi:SAM-dependent methyltransferase